MKKENKTALLAVSFGTSYSDSRVRCIEAVENALKEAFPELEHRRAFTSNKIINILKARDGIRINTVSQALEELKEQGFEKVIMQPSLITPAREYDELCQQAEKFRPCFESLKIAEPLLSDDSDYEKLMDAMIKDSEGNGENQLTVWMGHGTEHEANSVYGRLQKKLWDRGLENHILATVEASPDVTDALNLAEKSAYKKILLRPLMLVAGDHANNDMAGEEEKSWKNVFTAAGFETRCLLRGLGELEDVRNIYIEHTKRLI